MGLLGLLGLLCCWVLLDFVGLVGSVVLLGFVGFRCACWVCCAVGFCWILMAC